MNKSALADAPSCVSVVVTGGGEGLIGGNSVFDLGSQANHWHSECNQIANIWCMF